MYIINIDIHIMIWYVFFYFRRALRGGGGYGGI